MNLQPRAAAGLVSTRQRRKTVPQLARVEQFTREMIDAWNRIRESSASYASPYFDFEFTRAVARIRDDVSIGVLTGKSGEIVGFLPFQSPRSGHGQPAGGWLNDVHGIMKYDNADVNFRDVLEQCGLTSYAFHALAGETNDLSGYVFDTPEAHYIDMSDGWEAYRRWVRKHSSTVKRQGQKTRGLERDIGEIRFEFDCLNADALEELIELKRAKYTRSKTFDILSVDWACNLLREIHRIRKPGFQGLLSCMWAGDKLVAAHFGMLADRILHYWFPSFDNRFSRYSPGTELILRVCEEASRRGVTMVDFGYGDDPYKFKFCNASTPLSRGLVTESRAAFVVASQRYRLRTSLKKIPLKSSVKTILRGIYPGFGGWKFR
ncbi:MAG: GNAT family N-acetyltransferase [Planctomycetota bacterium]